MEHWQYRRTVKGSGKAFLFVHGILGTPRHFDFLLSALPETVSVYNLLLDGHGKDPRAFSQTSMKKWETQVQKAVEELLSSHEKVYIVAHSMGTLLAIEQGIKNPGVAGLFLMAAPLKLSLKPRLIKYSMQVYWNRIDPHDPVAMAAKRCYGITAADNPFLYIGWIPRFLELFSKIRRTRRLLPQLKTPCVVLLSGKDELVSLRSALYFGKKPVVRQWVLPSSGHYYYPPEDRKLLLWAFQDFYKTP